MLIFSIISTLYSWLLHIIQRDRMKGDGITIKTSTLEARSRSGRNNYTKAHIIGK